MEESVGGLTKAGPLFVASTTVITSAAPADVLRTPSSTERQVARLAAIQSEIQWIAGASQSWPWKSVLAWRRWTLAGQVPFTLIKRKTGRLRLPRQLKRELIDRFCTGDEAALKSLTTVIVVAHPDDESIGAGGRLLHLGDA